MQIITSQRRAPIIATASQSGCHGKCANAVLLVELVSAIGQPMEDGTVTISTSPERECWPAEDGDSTVIMHDS